MNGEGRAAGNQVSAAVPQDLDAPGRQARVDVSAVIPTHNRADLVTHAVQSILDGTVLPHEIIVVDDGSTDDTQAMLARFGERVRVIHQPNSGPAVARNHGVEAAQCEWVAFLDSDDVWRAEHLQRAEEAILETGGRADLYFADVEFPDSPGGGGFWADIGFAPAVPNDLVDDASEWALRSIQPMIMPAAVVRRARFLEIGGFDRVLWHREDTDLFFRLCIGRPACAFTGGGAVVGGAAPARLTSRHGSQSQVYWESTARMYERVSRVQGLSPAGQRQLRARLAVAHRWLAARALRRSAAALTEALRHLAAALRADPRELGRPPSRVRDLLRRPSRSSRH